MDLLIRPCALNRPALLERYRQNRKRSAALFDLVRDSMYERPLALRHPFVFYLGHIAAFHFNTLAKRALGYTSFHPEFDDLFRRGIDPESSDAAFGMQSIWPAVDAVQAYAARIDEIMEAIISDAELIDDANPYLRRAESLYTVLEHEEMHQETLIYILTCLDDAKKYLVSVGPVLDAAPDVRPQRITIPSGRVTLGANRDEIPFGWDNEFESMRADVAAFALESLPVTNGRYRRFVDAGAAAPAHWLNTADGWMQRTLHGLVPLQDAWPVYVSLQDAQAFAEAHHARIMTEAEYHRAAFAERDGSERAFPWGNAAPAPTYGNFDFDRFQPQPVGMKPAGASVWGVQELVGNGWEWTSTKFAPLRHFSPMASYPEYSADFFDDKHAVLKGASPVTSANLLRPSLRNWFRTDYPYAYTKFRLAYSV